MLKKCMAMIVIGWLVSGSASAGQKEEVSALLQSRIDAVLAILPQKDMPQEEKNRKIMEIVEPVFDFALMAKLTLGKTGWQEMNDVQQKEFIDLFVARLKASYLDKSSLYSDEKVAYKPAVEAGDKIHAAIDVIGKEKTVEVVYKFYSSAGAWKIYDVEINGVSLIQSYKSQFTEILKNGTVANLLEELRKTSGN
ncbi:MAG: ABC transporter substrate-binding protein [Desulfobacterales bacterium]|nr:ABC transporter substrate-binding protein [Desulfobacterales bacterium]